MRAVFYDRAGPASEVLTLGDLPKPTPERGAVLVRVHASGVNPSDVKQRGGAPGRRMGYPRIVPHNDGAGVIESVGAGVPENRVGTQVWVHCAQQGQAFGTAAEYVTVPADRAIALPAGIGFAEGAGLGVPAMTASHAVFGFAPVLGRDVLVTGGAGGVGGFAVQMAAAGGARVIATARSPEKQARAKEFGAAHAIDSSDGQAGAAILNLTNGRGVDLCIDVDFAGNAALLAAVCARGGTVVSYGSSNNDVNVPIRDLRQKNVTLQFFTIYIIGRRKLATHALRINNMIAKSLIHARPPTEFSLAECAEAHSAVEQGAPAKVVVRCL